jgi:hypothetical protein
MPIYPFKIFFWKFFFEKKLASAHEVARAGSTGVGNGLHVCVCVCMCISTYVHTHTHTHNYHIHIHTHTYTYTYTYTHVCMHACMYVYITYTEKHITWRYVNICVGRGRHTPSV